MPEKNAVKKCLEKTAIKNAIKKMGIKIEHLTGIQSPWLLPFVLMLASLALMCWIVVAYAP